MRTAESYEAEIARLRKKLKNQRAQLRDQERRRHNDASTHCRMYRMYHETLASAELTAKGITETGQLPASLVRRVLEAAMYQAAFAARVAAARSKDPAISAAFRLLEETLKEEAK